MRRSAAIATVIAAALLMSSCRPAPGDPPPERTVAIAAASDLKDALDEMSTALSNGPHRIRLQVSLGSSGNLFAQLGQGAPFDLFLSADEEYPSRLASSGMGDPYGEFAFAIGRLALSVRAQKLPPGAEPELTALTDPAFRTIAIANPDHAPYGRAAVAALGHYDLTSTIKPKLVLGETVGQAAEFVASGAADAGLISLGQAESQTLASATRHIEIAPSAYPPLLQGGLVMKKAADPGAATEVREFILGPEGRTILEQNQFDLPRR